MRKIIRTLTFLFYLVIVLFILPEISLRLLGFHGEENSKTFIRQDKELGWSLVPDADAIDEGFEWRIKYKINKDGFRDKPRLKEKRKGIYRALMLGDSFVEGYGIQQDKRFSELTEAMCNKDLEKVEIINAGVRGYNLAQYYILFQSLYKKYKPDLVVIVPCLGDLDVVTDRMLIDNAAVYYRPFYRLQDEELILRGVPVPEPDKAIFQNDKFETLKKSLRGTAFYSFLRISSDRNIFLKKMLTLIHLKKDVSKNSEYQERLKYLYDSSNDPMLYNKEINRKISKVIIRNILNETKQNNGRLLIFLLSDDLVGTNERFYKELRDDMRFDYYNFAESNDKYRKNSRKYHFRFDLHLNEKGNELVSESLYEFLQKNAL